MFRNQWFWCRDLVKGDQSALEASFVCVCVGLLFVPGFDMTFKLHRASPTAVCTQIKEKREGLDWHTSTPSVFPHMLIDGSTVAFASGQAKWGLVYMLFFFFFLETKVKQRLLCWGWRSIVSPSPPQKRTLTQLFRSESFADFTSSV